MTEIPHDTPRTDGAALPRLSDSPNWLYLLREFEAIYRYGSPGGSKTIRGHRRRVRANLSMVIGSNPEILAREPSDKPVTAYLPRALDIASRGAVSALGRAFGHVVDAVTWEYGYERVPKALARKYAYCEIVGPKGPVRSERLILGFVLFAPKTTYPQHSHQDIEESYISVAGSWSENDAAVYAPGSLILNSPGHEHRITTGDQEPCLLAYAWAGSEDRLAAPGMKFSSTRKARAAKGI